MPFLNVNIMNDQPNDPKVNVVTQLNDNWDIIDLRFREMQSQPVALPTNPDVGQQYGGADANQVWTGSSWKSPVAGNTSWSAWSTISGFVAPFVGSASFPPQYRTNSVLRQVEMRGRIQNTASGSGWDNFYYDLNPMSVGVPIAFAPIDDKVMFPACSSLSAISSSAIVIAEKRVGQTIVWFQMKQNGQMSAATGNYISFDNVRWFY